MPFWTFFKTYRVKCPDGSTKVVYRDVDEAYPLALSGSKSKFEATAKGAGTGQGTIKREHEEKIQGLLFGLDELNQGLMLTFRGVYLTYKSDPCAGHEFLVRENAKLLQEQQRLQRIRMQIDGLILLAKTTKSNGDFTTLFQSILNQLSGPLAAPAAVIEIKATAEQVQKWIGGQGA